eukprot:746073-Hanusia_phi.AAC.7
MDSREIYGKRKEGKLEEEKDGGGDSKEEETTSRGQKKRKGGGRRGSWRGRKGSRRERTTRGGGEGGRDKRGGYEQNIPAVLNMIRHLKAADRSKLTIKTPCVSCSFFGPLLPLPSVLRFRLPDFCRRLLLPAEGKRRSDLRAVRGRAEDDRSLGGETLVTQQLGRLFLPPRLLRRLQAADHRRAPCTPTSSVAGSDAEAVLARDEMLLAG